MILFIVNSSSALVAFFYFDVIFCYITQKIRLCHSL